jgi:hypothetical protein
MRRHERARRGSGSARNGAYDQTVATEIGESCSGVPLDRNGSFEQAVVPTLNIVDFRADGRRRTILRTVWV